MKRVRKSFICLLSVLMALVCVFAFAGCGAKEETTGGSKTKTIAFVQLAENGAFADMRTGFEEEMEALGYDVTYRYENAQGDATMLNQICQELMDSDVDMIVPIVTPATQAAVNAAVEAESDKPIIFISVTSPVGAGIMSDMSAPDKNATGTSNAVPVSEIFSLADTLTPSIGTYGLLYCSSETNAVLTIENAKAYLDEQGISYVEKIVTSSSEVQQAAQALAAQCDAIYVPIDSTVQTAMDQVASVATEAGIPVYGSSLVMVQSGALATVAVSDTEIGAMSAKQADEYFQGTPISEIPAVTLDSFTMIINENTAAALGVTVPDDENVTVISVVE